MIPVAIEHDAKRNERHQMAGQDGDHLARSDRVMGHIMRTA